MLSFLTFVLIFCFCSQTLWFLFSTLGTSFLKNHTKAALCLHLAAVSGTVNSD